MAEFILLPQRRPFLLLLLKLLQIYQHDIFNIGRSRNIKNLGCAFHVRERSSQNKNFAS